MGDMADNPGLCYSAPMLRRTSFQSGPLANRLGALAAEWGLRSLAGPGSGCAALLRIALRAAVRSRPAVTIPKELVRPADAGSKHTIFLDATDDAAIAELQELYALPSQAAACRVALWLVDQHGLSIVLPEDQNHLTEGAD